MAEAASSRSFDEALFELSRHTGAQVPKRQAEQLAVRAAEDCDAFYEARRAAAGEPTPDESVVVLTFDGKGVVLHREDLREATRRAAERRRRQREQLSPFQRLQPGEKKHSKRMATVAAVYAVAPFVRSPEEFSQWSPRPVLRIGSKDPGCGPARAVPGVAVTDDSVLPAGPSRTAAGSCRTPSDWRDFAGRFRTCAAVVTAGLGSNARAVHLSWSTFAVWVWRGRSTVELVVTQW